MSEKRSTFLRINSYSKSKEGDDEEEDEDEDEDEDEEDVDDDEKYEKDETAVGGLNRAKLGEDEIGCRSFSFSFSRQVVVVVVVVVLVVAIDRDRSRSISSGRIKSANELSEFKILESKCDKCGSGICDDFREETIEFDTSTTPLLL